MRTTSDGFFDYQGDFRTYQGTHLPHWDVDDGLYFVTFRLADSLPADELERLSVQYHRRLQEYVDRGAPEAEELAEFGFELYLETIDTRLADHQGACHLRDDRVARLVRDSLRHFDGERYTLFVWAIMPNHVHVVFRRHPDHRLGKVVGDWKSYTAHRAREMVEYGDHFWQDDYFDRLIRDEDEFRDVCRYVWRDPERSGLGEWPWRGLERRRTAGREAGDGLAP